MSLTPEQLEEIAQRYYDPNIPEQVKDADMTLLRAECDQVLAAVGEMVDSYADQIATVLEREDMTVEKSESILATYLYATKVPCGQVHNMFVVAMHKLVDSRKRLDRMIIELAELTAGK